MQKYVCEPCGYEYDPAVVIRTTESLQELLLKIFRKIGYAHCAEWEKKYLFLQNRIGI